MFRVVCEGETDRAFVSRILGHLGVEDAPTFYVTNGKHNLDRRLAGYNAAAQRSPWLVLRDLDQDAACPGELVARLLPEPSQYMSLRIAVRSMEAWAMSDREAFSDYFGVRIGRVPNLPETLADPKSRLIDLSRTSRKRWIRKDVPPKVNSRARVGPAFSVAMMEYANSHWRIEPAARNSPSLQRSLNRIARFV